MFSIRTRKTWRNLFPLSPDSILSRNPNTRYSYQRRNDSTTCSLVPADCHLLPHRTILPGVHYLAIFQPLVGLHHLGMTFVIVGATVIVIFRIIGVNISQPVAVNTVVYTAWWFTSVACMPASLCGRFRWLAEQCYVMGQLGIYLSVTYRFTLLLVSMDGGKPSAAGVTLHCVLIIIKNDMFFALGIQQRNWVVK